METEKTTPPAPRPQHRSSLKAKVFVFMIAALLVFLGGYLSALQIVGTETTAVVTDVRRGTSYDDQGMDRNYDLSYRFVVEGQTYHGQTSRGNVMNITHLPREGSHLRVVYWPGYPRFNTEKGGFLGGVLIGALGLFLLIMTITGKVTVGRR